MAELQDSLTGKETEAAELRNQIDDLQYELLKVQSRNDKLENHLAEAIEKLKTYQQIHGEDKGIVKPAVTTSVSQKKVIPSSLASKMDTLLRTYGFSSNLFSFKNNCMSLLYL
jgi:E3 ubiquitin-protein ligase BRE1